MTIGERIKKMRKEKDLTQREFGEQIGTTQNNIASYEIGRREPSAAVLNNICKTFNVNETWLRTGEGEIFVPKPETIIDRLIEEFHLGDMEKQIILEFLQLEVKDRQGVIKYVKQLAKNQVFQAAGEQPQETPEPKLTPEQEIDLEVERYRQQLLSEKRQESQALFVKESDVG